MDNFSFKQFVIKMHETNWLRLLVCVGPGIVITKLGSTFEVLSGLKMTGTVVLIVGGLIYAFWHLLSKKIYPADLLSEPAIEPDTNAEKPTQSTITIDHLVVMCNGDFQKASKLVALESQIDPSLTYQEAIRIAFQRFSKS